MQATIVTQGRGYVVRLDGHSFDVHRAGELLVSARDALREAAPQRAVDLASEVVALYRGEPYADVAYQDWIQPEVHRLNELRMEATEVLYAARLELGHHGELIAALESLVAAHPLRERLRGLLMLALYRAGRQADALRCFSAGRAALVDELGIEPGPELRELERRILEQDRTLDARIEPVRAVVASGVIGRARERQGLTAALRAATTGGTHVVLVHGEPGIGKTALANWLITEAEAAGAIVGHGRAPAIGGAPPFWPWTEALRSIVEARPASLSKLTRSDVEVLARLVPELAERASPASSGLPSAFMFDSVSRLLLAASTDDPLVLVLDDLHWADEGSLDLFNFVATSRSRSRILLVGLARPDVEPRHPVARAPRVVGVATSGRAPRPVRTRSRRGGRARHRRDRITAGRAPCRSASRSDRWESVLHP